MNMTFQHHPLIHKVFLDYINLSTPPIQTSHIVGNQPKIIFPNQANLISHTQLAGPTATSGYVRKLNLAKTLNKPTSLV